MVKKGLLIGAGVLVLLGLLFGRDGFSHLKTSVGWVRQSVHDSVPVVVEYAQTEYGKTLDDVIEALHKWGRQHRKRIVGK